MSIVNDILFEPIYETSPYQSLLDKIQVALNDENEFVEFCIDPDVPIKIYDKIAELIENDARQIATVSTVLSRNPKRPTGSLSIRDVFRRLHRGESTFYFAARGNGIGINEYEFANWFSVDGQMATLQLVQDPPNLLFEWWVISLFSQFTGYNEYYSFGTKQDALNYYGLPVP